MFGKKKQVDSSQEYFESNSDFDPNYNPYANNDDFQNVEQPQQFEEYHDEYHDDIETAYEEVVTSRSRKNRKEKKGHKKTKIEQNKTKQSVFKTMQSKIEGYGFRYSFNDFTKTTAIFIGGCIIVGYFLKLEPFYICALILIALMMLPSMIQAQFKYIYEQKRFNELVVYMEQMAYSFKKNPKILLALQDTAEVTSGHMNKLVNKAIYHIQNAYSDKVYEEALHIIQDEYECSRLVQLHRFLTKIEARGGNFQNSMDILLDDISSWSKRTFVFQKERADIKRKIMLSLILSMCICSTTIFMIPDGVDFTSSMIYQVSTVGTLTLFLGIYTLTQTKLNGSWLENDAIKDEQEIVRNYTTAVNAVEADAVKKAKKKMAICAPILLFGLFTKDMTIIVFAAVAMFLLYQQPKLKLKNATEKTVREIEKEIPSWCREVALNLQTENVYQAMYLTLNDCPIVLREPLRKFFDEANRMPESIIPYNNFLSEFNIPEVGRMMKTLYSINEAGSENADIQINKIIVQNNAMLEKAEEMKNEDSAAGIGALTLVPMFLGSGKMLIDLALLMFSFISLSQGAM